MSGQPFFAVSYSRRLCVEGISSRTADLPLTILVGRPSVPRARAFDSNGPIFLANAALRFFAIAAAFGNRSEP